MAITVGIKTGPLYFLLLFLYVYSLAQLHACWGRFLLHVMTITGHLTTCSPTLSLFLFSISCSYFNKGSVCLLSTSLDVLGAVASVLVKTRGRGCWCWVMISHDACCSLPPRLLRERSALLLFSTDGEQAAGGPRKQEDVTFLQEALNYSAGESSPPESWNYFSSLHIHSVPSVFAERECVKRSGCYLHCTRGALWKHTQRMEVVWCVWEWGVHGCQAVLVRLLSNEALVLM